jgi:nitrogen fixation/metabolism regulation signal transduction histidine kinase
MGYRSDLLGSPAIIVADNGPGFSDEPDTLIRPFFSRRPDGMGLGLYYANLVMELNGGRLAFPDAEEAEIPAEFDGAVVALLFGKEGKF